MTMNRRQAIKTTAIAAAAVAASPHVFSQPAPAPATGPFTLPPLPYAYDALEPYIDARTMQIHHDKHHAAYVANLNKAVADYPDLAKRSIEDLLKRLNEVPGSIRTAVRNNGGGHYNHSLFWQMMKKDGGGEPKGDLAKAIEANFGNFTNFKREFSESATKVFGSGWAWLTSSDITGTLTILNTANQDTPLEMLGAVVHPGNPNDRVDELRLDQNIAPPSRSYRFVPILGLDVWEHAYYLNYQNKRADYIAAWWNVVNWDFVTERYLKTRG